MNSWGPLSSCQTKTASIRRFVSARRCKPPLPSWKEAQEAARLPYPSETLPLHADDRVVIPDDLPVERLRELEARGLPVNTRAYIRNMIPGDVAEVVFESGRVAFVRVEDLRVTAKADELARERERMAERAEMNRHAEALAYYTPETVEQAYSFGRRSAMYGHALMTQPAFLVTAGEHPYPESLWRAYLRGHREGKRRRKEFYRFRT